MAGASKAFHNRVHAPTPSISFDLFFYKMAARNAKPLNVGAEAKSLVEQIKTPHPIGCEGGLFLTDIEKSRIER